MTGSFTLLAVAVGFWLWVQWRGYQQRKRIRAVADWMELRTELLKAEIAARRAER